MRRYQGTGIMGLLIFLLFLNACSSYPIEDLGMVYALGIDDGEQSHHHVSVRIPVFDPEAEAKSLFLEGEGVSIRNALKSINEQTERHLVLGQTWAVVVGEQLAKEGIHQHLDILTRDPQFPLNAGLFICHSKAWDFIREPVSSSPRFGDYLKDALKTAEKDGFVLGTNLNYFYIRRLAEGWDPCLPFVTRNKSGIRQLGIALFKDDKMVGDLGMVESQFLVVLDGRVSDTPLGFDDPAEPDTGIADRKYVSVEVVKAKPKVRMSLENGTVQINIRIKLDVDIVDKESLLELVCADTLKKYEESFAQEFSSRAERLIEKLQALQTDPLGLGAYLRMQHYETWKQMGGEKTWREFWQGANVTVKTNLKIRRFGVVVK